MTTTNDKLRAVVLAALMVLSVVAMGTAFVGTAGAAPTAGTNVTANNTVLGYDAADSNKYAASDIQFNVSLNATDHSVFVDLGE